MAVLTLFSTLKNVSIYSVYYNVTNGVEQIVMTAATGLESLFGNMIANNEKEKLLNTFSVVEWITHAGVTAIFTIAAITIVPFVSVYTRGITDADYIVPLFGVLLVIAYATQCLRVPYFRIIKAAGHFKETQNGAYISAGLNIVITISLVFKYGLVGAAIGTLVAMLYHTCYFVWYLRKHILSRSARHFVGYILTDALVATASYFITNQFSTVCTSYYCWIIFATKVAAVVLVISCSVNLIIYKTQMKSMLRLLRNR